MLQCTRIFYLAESLQVRQGPKARNRRGVFGVARTVLFLGLSIWFFDCRFPRSGSRLTRMAITPAEIEQAVTKEDDFGFEMRAGSAMRAIAGVEVQHGGTYTDPVTNKPRQFDYRCFLRREITGPKYTRAEILSFAVECKNLSPSSPLVVCRTVRRQEEAFHDLVQSHLGTFKSKHRVTAVGESSITRRATGTDSAYKPGEFVGKSVIRLRLEKTGLVAAPHGDIYEKWAQAISSSVDIARSACRESKERGVPCAISSVLSVVVVPDDVLWTVDYDDSGKIIAPPRAVESCEFFVGRKIRVGIPEMPQRFTTSHVHFFTLTGFGAFLGTMNTSEIDWHRFFTVNAKEL